MEINLLVHIQEENKTRVTIVPVNENTIHNFIITMGVIVRELKRKGFKNSEFDVFVKIVKFNNDETYTGKYIHLVNWYENKESILD